MSRSSRTRRTASPVVLSAVPGSPAAAAQAAAKAEAAKVVATPPSDRFAMVSALAAVAPTVPTSRRVAQAAPAPAPAPKVCTKTTPWINKGVEVTGEHGEHRITRTGSYCYACDRIVAEKQNAERRAAKAAGKK